MPGFRVMGLHGPSLLLFEQSEKRRPSLLLFEQSEKRRPTWAGA
jgi:hypothetical protein